MNKKISLLFSVIILFLTMPICAQYGQGGGGNNGGGGGMGGNQGGGSRMGGAGMGGARPSIGHIYGKVVEDDTKKGVEFASVALYTLRTDSLIGGQLTEGNGDFSLENLPLGGYKLKITFLGYNPVEQKVIVTLANAEQDLGNIKMTENEKTLNTVTVTGEKSMMELKPDRKVFNVEKDLSARGGDAVDVMKNIPGVSTDESGNVTLRNSTPIIYVDGKPTTLTLEQIPADQIDRVEVITNPSAKFEADAAGGIINIILKKNQKPGYNGSVTAAIGTNDQFNGMALLNVREKKFGFMLNYNVNGSTNRYTSYTQRESLLDGTPTGYMRQDDNFTNRRLFQTARAGFDYYITNRNTLSLTQSATFGNFNVNDPATYNMKYGNDSLENYGTRGTDQTVAFRNYTTDLSFRHTYPKPDKEWTLDLNYNHSHGTTGYLYSFTTYDPNGDIVPYTLASTDSTPSNPAYETESGYTHSNQFIVQWDFTDPIGKTMKLEFGARAYYQMQYSSLDVIDSVDNEGQTNPYLSNQYKTNTLINAAYVTFSQSIKGFSYQIGLRVEETYFYALYYNALLTKGDSSFSYQYPESFDKILQCLFPSLAISQKFGSRHELQFNVTRKTKRPNFFQISPFIFATDKYDYQIGNPSLQPEFDNKAEINYDLTLKGFNWLSSIYGSYNQQPITQYSYLENDSSDVLINSFVNGRNSWVYGWENTFKISPVKGLDITLDGTVYYTDLVTDVDSVYLNNSGYSFTGKAIVSYKFPWAITVQANGTYETPRIIAQGHTLPFYFFDLSAAKEFGVVSLTLAVSDVLNSKIHGYYYDTPTYIQTATHRRDERFARLGMNIKFGRMDSSLFAKKKKKPAEQQGGEEDMGF